jgi:prolyl 4-hydroxylase
MQEIETVEKENTKTELSLDPLVVIYDNLLTDEECQHFINISKGSLKRALVSEDKKGVESQGRTGQNTWIAHDHDDITKRVGEKIASIVGLPLENAEKYQVIYYNKTQEYRNHYDSWVHNGSEKTLRCMKYGGARLKTALCYLNDVKKGGGTKMSKLDLTVEPKKGRLLVFQNTISHEDHTRHEFSEHAGLPVEDGEKFAFNLWFKECNSKRLYSDFNPDYYKNTVQKDVENTEKKELTESTEIDLNDILSKEANESEFILNLEDTITATDIINITNNVELNSNKRRSGWLQLSKYPKIAELIKEKLNIDAEYCENINVVEYPAGDSHGPFHDAYDLNSDRGKKYTTKYGQRLFTVTLFLSDNLDVEFPELDLCVGYSPGDCLIYRNVLENSDTRNVKMEHIIRNKSKTTGLLANIYVRNKNKNGKKPIIKSAEQKNITESIKTTTTESKKIIESTETTNKSIELKITEFENYTKTLEEVLTQFKNNEITPSWNGHESFKYNFKGDFELFKQDVLEYKKIKEELPNKSCLIEDNLSKTYVLDPKLPLAIVNNVLEPSVLEVFKKYYKRTIDSETWVLGDRQSNRYKAHNEPMSRFLHYECLPLIERIVGKKMKPTYTYLSAYVKGADLPQHTDRPECEYTVSFVVDKPEGSNWNIYVHKPQQPVKHKGRYDEKPPIEECDAVDCDAGGLMMFQGTDHIHFREKLEHEYYNVLLLHYCSV